MITPILENLVLTGAAKVLHKTVGQNGVSTISVPNNQSIVITKISIQPFVNPQFKDGFGQTAGGLGTIPDIQTFIQELLGANFNDQGQPQGSNNIVYEMLRRGTFQIELYSSDNNNTIFTYGTDYNFVQTFPDPSNIKVLLTLLPALSERSTDCFSVHKNNVHVKLRFTNKLLNDPAIQQFFAPFDNYNTLVSTRQINNTIPENRPVVDINSNNLYFNGAVYTNDGGGNKFGFYPFGVETNFGTLSTFNSSDTITFPYLDENTNVPMAGDGGEASFYSQNKGTKIANLVSYMNLFIPYINIEYVLINAKADGDKIITPEMFNKVTVSK